MQLPTLAFLLSQLDSLLRTILFNAAFAILLAVVLQSAPAMRSAMWRAFFGTTTAVALLYISPVVYARPGQHMAIGLSTLCYMTALTMLDWSFLQPAASQGGRKASMIKDVILSILWQPMSGVIAAQKVKRKKLQARNGQATDTGSSSSANSEQQQRRTTDAVGQAGPGHNPDAKVKQHKQQGYKQQPPQWQFLQPDLPQLQETLVALLLLMVRLDIGTAIMHCCFCSNRFAPTDSFYASMPATQVLGPRVAQFALYCVAGVVLVMQLGMFYMPIRMGLLTLGISEAGPVHAFDSPWLSTSVTELWAIRWHQLLRYYFVGLGYTLSDKISASFATWLPPQWQTKVKATVRTLVVFAISGLVHDYMIWGAFGVFTGEHTAFFMLHGLAVLIEGLGSKAFPAVADRIPMWLRRVWVVAFAFATCPLFVRVLLEHGHYRDYVPPFLVPISTVALQSVGLCNCA